MSAQWPTAVATDSNLYVAVNELQTNLSAGINNAVTTIGLNSTTSFPTVGLVLIDNEIIKYTGISGLNLTGCTRAFDGTSAATHSSGAAVSFAFCAAHHNVIKDEIEAIETYLSANLGLTSQPLANGSRALASNGSGKIIESSVTSTELGYVSGVSSAIQTQLTGKASTDLSNVASVSANVAMNSHKFTGLSAGSGNGDSVRYEQVIGVFLPLTGGTMSGAIAMGSNKVTGLAAATANGDAVRFEQLGGFQAAVQSTTTTPTTTTSTSYVDTSLSASITLTNSAHRVKITVTGCLDANSGTAGLTSIATITGTTNGVLSAAAGFVRKTSEGASVADSSAAITYIDSPGTTSAQTYKVQIKSSSASNSCQWIRDSSTAVMILEEIV